MVIFLTIIHVIVCFVLILVILLQAGKGQGLSSASFGSGNVQSVLGTGAADFLTKATTAAAILFILTCISLDFIEVRRSRSLLQAGDQSAPIGLDEIQKALEKVKEEAAASGVDPSTLPATVEEAEALIEKAKAESSEAAAEAEQQGEALKEEAQQAASDAANAAKAAAAAVPSAG